MKKLAIFNLFAIFILFFFPSSSYAQANIISDPTHADYAVSYDLNQTIVFAGDPDNPQQIIKVCNQTNVCVIRGHAHWIYGNEMLKNPESAAQKWSNALEKIAADTSGQVYFEPWNEPMRLDMECGNLDTTACADRIQRFINNLNTHGITLTSPAIDPYHPNSAAMISALGNIPYSVISMHIYSPQMARNYRNVLSSLGVRGASSMKVILTETGALNGDGDNIPDEGGTPTYREMILCNMYCYEINGQTTVDFWKSQGINYALFSLGPDGIPWNLWEADCVIDALKGNCHCETCDEDTESPNAKKIAKEMYDRTGGRKPSLESETVRVGRNWPGGGTTMETHNNLWDILMWLIKIIFGEVKILFRIFPGQGLFESTAIIKLIEVIEILAGLFPSIEFLGYISDNLGSQQLVPSDRGGRFPGEDYYVDKTIKENKLELPGTTAQICLPDRDIDYTFLFFPDQHEEEFGVELLNLTSIHRQLTNSLQVYLKMRQWISGSAYSDYKEYIDMTTKEGERKMAFRGFTEQLQAGYMVRRLPGVEFVMEGENWANQRLRDLLATGDPKDEKSPLFDAEDIEKGIGIADKPILRVCDGPITENDYTLILDDNRVNRKEIEGCNEPREIKISELCCNREHIEYLGLDYNEVCKYHSGWICKDENPDEPEDSWLLYGNKYSLGKFASDSGISEADLPIYLEQCFEVPQTECSEKESYNGLFVDLNDQERARVFPPSTWNDTNPRNTFLTRHEGKCLSCQVVKLFLPQGLGALDACREMTATYLPDSMYQKVINEDYPQKKVFDCDVGELPNTDAPEGNKANEDFENFQNPWHERFHGFITQSKVINNFETNYTEESIPAGTGPEGEPIEQIQLVPEFAEVNVKVKSQMRLYIPHYEKLQLCTELMYGLLPKEYAEELEKELEEMNEHKLEAKDLLVRTKVNDAGTIYSGLDTIADTNKKLSIDDIQEKDKLTYPLNRIRAWLDNPKKIWGRSNISQDEDIYLPGGGADAGLSASQNMYIPASLQSDWFSGSGANRTAYDPSEFSQVWNNIPNEMMNIPAFFRTEIVSLKDKIIQIAKEVDVPPEVPFVLWLKENGGKRQNPENGEGICGFYSLVNQGEAFPPGPISETELLRQLKLCAEEYKKRASSVNFDTTSPYTLGWGYAHYNGNMDCRGSPYPTWHDHPYVMNGYDSEHMNMEARKSTNYDDPDNCVRLSVIGAWPAHLRISELLSSYIDI